MRPAFCANCANITEDLHPFFYVDHKTMTQVWQWACHCTQCGARWDETRDPSTGNTISSVTLLEGEPQEWIEGALLDAKGILEWDGEPPEDAIRRLRDSVEDAE
jgi:hypothetical protein